jgi:hypothetical protein
MVIRKENVCEYLMKRYGNMDVRNAIRSRPTGGTAVVVARGLMTQRKV